MAALHCPENDAGVGLLTHGCNDQGRTAPVPGPTQLRANEKTSLGGATDCGATIHGATDGATSHPSLHLSAATSQPCGAAMQGATVLKYGALDDGAAKTVRSSTGRLVVNKTITFGSFYIFFIYLKK
jgi:hypothetical protein